MRLSRNPEIGDMIIFTPDSHDPLKKQKGSIECEADEEYVGVIYDIHFDKWGHKAKVLVQWSGDQPPEYNSTHGFSGTNIHNLRSKFKVIRGGIDIR